MNVNAGQDQKKALIQQLLDQYQAHAARAAGLAGAASGPAIAASLPSTRPFGGIGHVTAALPSLAQSLIERLGPGGFGRPIAGVENSPGRGAPVSIPAAANPRAGAAVNAPVAPPAPPAVSPVVQPSAQGSSAAIPIGGGLVYHPVLGIMPAIGRTGSQVAF